MNVLALFHRILLMAVLLTALPACAAPYPSHYSAEAIEAKVIDADTKKPIDGVIVTANWQLLGGMEGSLPLAQMQVMETQTGPDGVFRFPAWGPLKRPQGYLREDDPHLLLFKPGYEYQRLANEVRSKINHDAVRRSIWNGRTIEMKRFRGTLKEYAEHLSLLKTRLGFAYNSDNCEWKQVPRMLAAQHKEMLRLDEKQIFNTLQSVERVSGQKKCGSAQEFFRSYLQ